MEKGYSGASAPISRTFFDKENQCEYLFNESVPFWHMFTPGNLTTLLFTNDEEFGFGMNLMGICADRNPMLKIYTFELMNNHLHCILSGDKKCCEDLFNMYQTRLQRYLAITGRVVELSAFKVSLLSIPDLHALRNEIVYVNRNGYLVKPSYTPFSYIWGAGYLYFNPIYEVLPSVTFNSLSIREKRNLCRSRDVAMSDRIRVLNHIILPSSFCYIKEGECFFRDAHHYFNLLSKNYEAYSEIAKRLKDSVFLSDEEMFSAVQSMCLKSHNLSKPVLLPSAAKIDIAKKMHYDYNASNKQIQRILKIDAGIIESLFPKVL
ncbi:MAG: hypothetical protein WC128_01830 [Bacteroidales bacterium]|jgi:hypothetical protein